MGPARTCTEADIVFHSVIHCRLQLRCTLRWAQPPPCDAAFCYHQCSNLLRLVSPSHWRNMSYCSLMCCVVFYVCSWTTDNWQWFLPRTTKGIHTVWLVAQASRAFPRQCYCGQLWCRRGTTSHLRFTANGYICLSISSCTEDAELYSALIIRLLPNAVGNTCNCTGVTGLARYDEIVVKTSTKSTCVNLIHRYIDCSVNVLFCWIYFPILNKRLYIGISHNATCAIRWKHLK